MRLIKFSETDINKIYPNLSNIMLVTPKEANLLKSAFGDYIIQKLSDGRLIINPKYMDAEIEAFLLRIRGVYENPEGEYYYA